VSATVKVPGERSSGEGTASGAAGEFADAPGQRMQIQVLRVLDDRHGEAVVGVDGNADVLTCMAMNGPTVGTDRRVEHRVRMQRRHDRGDDGGRERCLHSARSAAGCRTAVMSAIEVYSMYRLFSHTTRSEA
jgi:hypothetical protein